LAVKLNGLGASDAFKVRACVGLLHKISVYSRNEFSGKSAVDSEDMALMFPWRQLDRYSDKTRSAKYLNSMGQEIAVVGVNVVLHLSTNEAERYRASGCVPGLSERTREL
jgi:hypothetical protein